MKKLFFVVIIPVILGIFTGVLLGGGIKYFNKVSYLDQSGTKINLEPGQEFGIKNPKSTRDSSIGLLVESDDYIKGTHKLLRGADDLAVYLTSSVIDLNQFKGRGIQIWGETYQRKNIGWFMDVVKLKVIK